jgi:EXLDI family protein
MSNKTIYVSDKDEPLFDKAKEIAGEALSSVISRALREYVARNEKKGEKMKEIAIKVGSHDSEREQRFVGVKVGKWSGFSDDKVWLMEATIYQTQKKNWAVHLKQNTKATLLTDPQEWHSSGDYLENGQGSELIVGKDINNLKEKLPASLFATLQDVTKRYETPVEYLDI